MRHRSQQFARFKWLDDVRVRPNPARFLRLERLQLSHRQQDWDVPCVRRILQPLAKLQPAVARHINIQNNQVGIGFGDPLEGGGPVIDGNHVIPGIGQDLSAHVLGGHTVIGQQYFSRQASPFAQ